MDCLRGSAPTSLRRHPANARPYLLAYAVPYVWLVPKEIRETGMHLIVASNPRIPEQCVDPRAKNFHWADMTRAMFEAEDKGAHNPVLLDLDRNVTEGPGFNVFAVSNGAVATPEHGVLEGITRGAVIELCGRLGLRCEVRTVTLEELRAADEIFVSSTAGGVIGVTRLDGASCATIGRDPFRHGSATHIGGSARKAGALKRSTTRSYWRPSRSCIRVRTHKVDSRPDYDVHRPIRGAPNRRTRRQQRLSNRPLRVGQVTGEVKAVASMLGAGGCGPHQAVCPTRSRQPVGITSHRGHPTSIPLSFRDSL